MVNYLFSQYPRCSRNPLPQAIAFCVLCICIFATTAAHAQANAQTSAHPENRIIGGINGEPGAYPWMAGIVIARINDAKDGFVCGGTLIRPEWVLTAAHCVEGSRPGVPVAANLADIVIGRDRLRSNDGERIRAAEIIIHPKFARRGANDVALIRLSRPSAQPTLQMIEAGSELAGPGEIAMAIGYGRTDVSKKVASNRLKQLDIPIVSHRACRNVYQRIGLGGLIVPDLMICAGYETVGRGVCFGDSGSPLLAFNNQGEPRVAGVVNFGVGCALAGIPGVYARMTTYRDWVLVTLGEQSEEPLPELVLPPASGTSIFTNACTGLACEFNAIDTGDGNPISYVWSFGDGYFDYGPSTSHFYDKAGPYDVSLFVIDSDGSVVEDTRGIRPRSDNAVSDRKKSRFELGIGQQKNRFVPNRKGFWSRRGLITGTLKDKSGASDMQLDLVRFDESTGSWVTVATSNNRFTRERIDYDVEQSGYFAWIVRNRSLKDKFVIRYWRP